MSVNRLFKKANAIKVFPPNAKQTYLWLSVERLAQVHNASCHTLFCVGTLEAFIFLMEQMLFLVWNYTILKCVWDLREFVYNTIRHQGPVLGLFHLQLFSPVFLASHTTHTLLTSKYRAPSWTSPCTP
jgi:hypothetical protein